MDDEEGPRASLKVVFRSDYNVLLASNGNEALQHARRAIPDVAILDILMPGMSGVDVLRELKVLDADIEVIMLTAYETLDTARQALRHGAREYLNKPFDIPGLRTAVTNAIDRRQATREMRSASARLAELQAELSAGANGDDDDEAGNIIHDLNNPLTVISGFVELLNRQVHNTGTLQGDELEKMRTNLARVHGQVSRCLEISRRYLGSRRLDAAETGRAAVHELLSDFDELIRKHPSSEGHSIIVHGLEQPAHAAIHGADLLRILLNLATNALQSCPQPHRVEIIAQSLQAGFDHSSFVDGPGERFVGRDVLPVDCELVAISVRDTGPGIEPDIVSRLFNEQLTTKPVGQGHGLGLGSVKNLVTSARGAVRLSTKVGQGTTFTVFLPSV